MTELQMGLLGLGALAVVGVLGYNKWQEARQRKQAESMLQVGHPDVLLDGDAGAGGKSADVVEETQNVSGDDMPVTPPAEPTMSGRLEPMLRDETALENSIATPDEATSTGPAFRDEPPLSEFLSPDPGPAHDSRESHAATPNGFVEPTVAAGATPPPPDGRRLLSERIDFIAVIDVVEPVAAQRITDASGEALSRVRKPVNWIAYDEMAGEWRPISASSGGEFRHIRAGLQLVDRRGAVSEADLSLFASAMQDLADQLTGFAELPSRQLALETAAQLDQFCASVDIQIGINVISQGQPFQGTKLRALAEAAGMAIDESRRFVRRDDDGNVLFVLLNQEASGFTAESMRGMSTTGLTFLLDVPCVAYGERVFNQMVDLARRFADVLHGALVDDNRRPLSESALEPIRRQIGQYQAMLASRQLPAGNPLTQRLFS